MVNSFDALYGITLDMYQYFNKDFEKNPKKQLCTVLPSIALSWRQFFTRDRSRAGPEKGEVFLPAARWKCPSRAGWPGPGGEDSAAGPLTHLSVKMSARNPGTDLGKSNTPSPATTFS